MKIFKENVLAGVLILLISTVSVFAQDKVAEDKETAYTKVITQRADKIVATLDITDAGKYAKVRNIITEQYRLLNTHHEEREAQIKQVKEKYKDDKQQIETEVKNINSTADRDLRIIHSKYLDQLSLQLSPEQIEKVKDGMTYGVLPITYKGYQEMLPNLSKEQKTQILIYLTEARENAMDASSSEKKHAWFGKYKGKINNYLSAQGIDMNKASKEWQERIKAEKANNIK